MLKGYSIFARRPSKSTGVKDIYERYRTIVISIYSRLSSRKVMFQRGKLSTGKLT